MTTASFLENALRLLDALQTELAAVAEKQSKKLVAARERFCALFDAQRFQVISLVLPMDLFCVYLLSPG